MALAFSSSIPCRMVTVSLELPPAAGSGSPWSSAFSDTLRLIRRSLNTSSTALARSSLLALISTAFSPLQAIEAPVFLKSNRCPISLPAWFSALSTSWWSTLLTTSNDESATVSPPLSWSRTLQGGLPEWSKGTVCKTVGSAYVGSNPTPATYQTAVDQTRGCPRGSTVLPSAVMIVEASAPTARSWPASTRTPEHSGIPSTVGSTASAARTQPPRLPS